MADCRTAVSPSEPPAIAPVQLVDAGRLEVLVRHLFPRGAVIDLRPAVPDMTGAAPAQAHLHRVALEDGSRPAFRWCEVVKWHPVDWFAAHPPASIWEIDVIPVIRADGAIQPNELGGCARTHRQAVVRLCGQFVSAAPGEPQVSPAAEQQQLAAQVAEAMACLPGQGA